MSRWRAVLFDLDDTLYLERDYVLSGMQAVAVWAEEQLGYRCAESFGELRKLFEDGVRGNTFDRWLESHGLEPGTWVPKMVGVYREHQPRIAPLSGIRRLLERLRPRYALGLVSDGELSVQRRKFEALGLASCFQAVVFSDALGRDCWKPSPEPFAYALAQLEVRGEEAVYVADNPRKDFRGARTLGLDTIRFRHPQGIYLRAEPAADEDAPREEVHSVEELESLLDQGGFAETLPEFRLDSTERLEC